MREEAPARLPKEGTPRLRVTQNSSTTRPSVPDTCSHRKCVALGTVMREKE